MGTFREDYHKRTKVYCLLIFIVHGHHAAENIAYRKPTNQSSTYEYGVASNAVDGHIEQTYSKTWSHTGSNQSLAWWLVDLQQLSVIQQISIYYRYFWEQRFAGYQLFISNTTDRNQGTLCYQDTSSTKEEVDTNQTHQCPYEGRYVILYNERRRPKRHSWYSDTALLELSEVQVFGCPVRTYGSGNCDRDCSTTCHDNACDSVSGQCFYCVVGKYGDYCENSCSDNCEGNICRKDTGECVECIPGKHGIQCDRACSVNCEDQICDRTNGTCLKCISGKFGFRCENTCPEDCAGKQCGRVDGKCQSEKASCTAAITLTTVFACLAGVFFLATVSLLVVLLRLKCMKKKEESHYVDPIHTARSSEHIYELTTT